jgi:hypothetical protein
MHAVETPPSGTDRGSAPAMRSLINLAAILLAVGVVTPGIGLFQA